MSQKIIKREARIKENSSPLRNFPHRGEIYWADFTDEEESSKRDKIGKVRKKESQKDRPVVVISNDKQNQYTARK